MKNEDNHFPIHTQYGPLYSFSTISKDIEGNLDKIPFE